MWERLIYGRLWKVTRWFTPDWWRYLLTGCKGWTNFWCRVRGHPAGVWWYTSNPEAMEPDMHCKNCEEDLG